MAPWADEVITEEFPVHPKAFMGFIPLAAVGGIAAVFLFNFGGSSATSAISAALVLAGALMFVFEFLLYRRFVDFLFRKAVSKRLCRPQPTVRSSAASSWRARDAAWEWTWSITRVTKHWSGISRVPSGLFYALQSIWLSCVHARRRFLRLKVLGLIQFVFIPFFILIMFSSTGKSSSTS